MNLLIPLSWLRDYLKTDVTAKTIREQLSLCGPSVEREEKRGEDTIFDIEVTTNRPDAFSIYGIAREANAILDWQKAKTILVPPSGIHETITPQTKQLLNLEIKIDTKLCPRFTAVVLDNIKIAPSPALLKNRLEACGIRSINNIVDISNYAMLELGNPMHMFDYDKIHEAKMTLRESRKGESLHTLDGINRKLPEGTIVIEDADRLIDLCGIMGGENSAVSSRTKRIIVFVQAYDPVKIRKTTQTLAFRTDAASRFEKGIDLDSIPEALSRAVNLCKKYAGAKVASELIDIYPNKQKNISIELSDSKLSNYLGIDLKLTDAARILKSLGFSVKTGNQELVATPPHWRAADVIDEEDLIEEIACIYGYHNLPSELPVGQIPQEDETDLSRVIKLKTALKYLGLTETMAYSIIPADWLKLTEIKPQDSVELANPLSSDWQFMRPSLLVSLADVIAKNQNMRTNIKIFEIAKTYSKNGNELPIQELKIGIVLQNSNFEQIKGIVENLFEVLARPLVVIARSEAARQSSLLEPSLSAIVNSHNKEVGTIGILNHKVAQYFGIDGQTAVAELNLSTVYQLPATSNSYHPIPKFPPIIEDVSAIFAKETPVAEIIKTVSEAGKPLVKNIEILDIYVDPKIGKDKKSVTLRLYYQKTDGTPTEEDVKPIRESVLSALEKSLSAQIRK